MCSAPRLSGPTQICSSRSSGRSARARTDSPSSGRRPQRRQEPDRLLAQAAQRDLDQRRRRQDRATARRRARPGPGLARPARAARRARPARSRADPAAVSPGSASRSATSSARRRGGSERGRDLLEHGAEQLGEPGERERGLRLDAAAGSTRPNALLGLLDARLPEDRLADPGLAGEDERARALLDLGEERLDRGELLLAPDDRRHGSRLGRFVDHGEPRCELGAADAELAVDVREVRSRPCSRPCRARRRSPCSCGPAAASSATRRSVSVSSSEAGRAAADPPQLRARLLGPQAGAELLEDRERLLERLPGRLLLLRLPAHRAEAEQRAAALERVRMRVELGERAVERLEARRSESPSAAASRPRQRAAAASARGLPSCRACRSYGSRYARACSSSPSAISVSIASAQTGCVGSFTPRASSRPGRSRR